MASCGRRGVILAVGCDRGPECRLGSGAGSAAGGGAASSGWSGGGQPGVARARSRRTALCTRSAHGARMARWRMTRRAVRIGTVLGFTLQRRGALDQLVARSGTYTFERTLRQPSPRKQARDRITPGSAPRKPPAPAPSLARDEGNFRNLSMKPNSAPPADPRFNPKHPPRHAATSTPRRRSRSCGQRAAAKHCKRSRPGTGRGPPTRAWRPADEHFAARGLGRGGATAKVHTPIPRSDVPSKCAPNERLRV